MKTADIACEGAFMRIEKIRALRGANIWSRETVLECWLEFPPLMHAALGWKNKLVSMTPVVEPLLNQHEALPDKTALADVLLAMTLYLQGEVGQRVSYGKVVENAQVEHLRLIVQYEEEEVGLLAFHIACRMLESVLCGQDYDLPHAIEELRALAHHVCFGPSTLAIVEAAGLRGIPVFRQTTGNLVQLGWGSCQKKVLAAATSETRALAEDIVQDKELTRHLLGGVGLPVPCGRPVSSAEDAWVAALEIGLPVVVKPRDGSQGRGVALNLLTKEQIAAAYGMAKEVSHSIIVEQFIYGEHYRLLIVGQKLIAASRCEPAHVIGDGIQSVQALVDEVNRDPRRAPHHAAALSKIYIDAIALAVLCEQGMTPDSIPQKAQKVLIRGNSNISTGGTAVDVTDLVHPTNAKAAIEAAQIVGLDICGIDIIARDINQAFTSGNGVFIEINARPGLRMHLHPLEGEPRPVGHAIIETLFPRQATGRIPIVAVTGVNGKTTTTRFIAHLLTRSGCCVGMCHTDGISIGKRILDKGDCSGPKSAHALLADPLVDIAVLETARGGILREGLGFDFCDVAVVTNIGSGDHLGIDEVNTPEQLATVKKCIVTAVPHTGSIVLNADDPLIVKMADACICRAIFFGASGNNTVIQEHRKKGKRVVFTRDGCIICAEGDQEFVFLPLAEIPLTQGGVVAFQVENTLASVGAAWALDVDIDLMRTNARTFPFNIDDNSGRFNIFDIRGATVVIDYVHNIDALRALLEALRNFKHQRRIATYSSAGDRRDIDIIEQGRMLGAEFDEVWLYEGYYTRGRKPGEIMGLIARGLQGAVRAKRIEYIQGHLKAVDLLLETASPGDLVMIQADRADETLQHLQRKHGVRLNHEL